MRKSKLIILLLLVFVLCSCTNTLPETTEEPTGMENMPPEQVDTEEPHTVETVSIVFFGETITAPGVYPDVPVEYIPVLDDFYLIGRLIHQSATLRREVVDDNIEALIEINRESERVKREIRQRGNIPFPGDGSGTSGYALVDLDGDGVPELLALRHSWHEQPIICAVFAIRNGQLVCIYNGSSEIQDGTVLAADGTFYQSVNWRGTGYTNLKAFRLEAEKTEFTTISEARASLSFEEGDVPVPYWVKNENGVEISITEDDFDVLYEKYNNPGELMNLTFVAMHPDGVDLWPVPRPDEDSPPPTLIDLPQSYQGAPTEYKPVLDALYIVSERIRRDEAVDLFGTNCFDDTLEIIGFGGLPRGELGYAVVDINNDGILELILGAIDGLENAAPYSVFTLRDGEPVRVKSFWCRSSGVISADGTIYRVGFGGAAYTYLTSYRLEENAYTLTQLTSMSSDYSQIEERAYYIQVVDNRNHFITEDEFWDFFEKYNDPSDPMKLKVISIAN